MIGKAKSQFSLLDGVFNRRTKKSRTDALLEKGLVLRRGTIVDATLVKAARKKHKTDDDAPKSPQQDSAATATKHGKKGYFGYKGHIGVDQGSGIIRRVRFTTASAHDATERANLLSGDERAIFGDKGYADDDTLKREYRSTGTYYGVLDKGRRGRPHLSARQKKRNRRKNRIRAAVERPFAHFKHLMGYVRVRYVNLARNALHFTFLCMIKNIRTAFALPPVKG